MFTKAIEILEKGSEQYQNLMSKIELETIDDAVSELRNPCLNKNDLRKLTNKAQRIVYKYSKDSHDLDEFIKS